MLILNHDTSRHLAESSPRRMEEVSLRTADEILCLIGKLTFSNSRREEISLRKAKITTNISRVYFFGTVTTKCRGKLAIEHTTPGERHQDSRTVFFCFL